jgi:hypothetical protein
MANTADILSERSSTSDTKSRGDLREGDYRYALERVLTYLRALGVPEQKAADYAAEAVDRAEHAQNMHPVAAAMQALRAVLGKDQKALGCAARKIYSPDAGAGAGQITSMPPLNRDSMLAVELDRNPWWTFFTRYVLRKKP